MSKIASYCNVKTVAKGVIVAAVVYQCVGHYMYTQARDHVEEMVEGDNGEGAIAEELVITPQSETQQPTGDVVEAVLVTTDSVSSVINNTVHNTTMLEVKHSNYVPHHLERLYINRIVSEVRCRLGPIPDDTLHRRAVHRTANSVCSEHRIRPSQRASIVASVCAVYFIETRAVIKTRVDALRYARWRFSWGQFIARQLK